MLVRDKPAALASARTSVKNFKDRIRHTTDGAQRVVCRHAFLGQRESQKAQLEHDVASLDRRDQLSQIEVSRLEVLARAKAVEWRSLLKRHTPQARQILSKMLRDKLVFRPEQRGNRRGWRFTGEATITELLTGLVPEVSQAVASPMPASWNQIVTWLQGIDGLRRAA
jgi:hypothetical protein